MAFAATFLGLQNKNSAEGKHLLLHLQHVKTEL